MFCLFNCCGPLCLWAAQHICKLKVKINSQVPLIHQIKWRNIYIWSSLEQRREKINQLNRSIILITLLSLKISIKKKIKLRWEMFHFLYLLYYYIIYSKYHHIMKTINVEKKRSICWLSLYDKCHFFIVWNMIVLIEMDRQSTNATCGC